MKSKEFKHWLAKQGATFAPGKGSHLKVYLNAQPSLYLTKSKKAIKRADKRIKARY